MANPEIIDKKPNEPASEAAFTATSMTLHALRPKLRTVVPAKFIGHPAYDDDNFPIWWQGQNNDQFIKQAKPPSFVRFSHHPSNTYQGIYKGHANIQVYAQTEVWIEALEEIVVEAFPVGDLATVNDLAVTIRSAEPAGVWPVKGWDRTKPWPQIADFMLSISIWWQIDLNR